MAVYPEEGDIWIRALHMLKGEGSCSSPAAVVPDFGGVGGDEGVEVVSAGGHRAGREGGRERRGREGGEGGRARQVGEGREGRGGRAGGGREGRQEGRRVRRGREGGRDRVREGGREGGEGREGGRERGREREREVDETWHPGGQNRATISCLPNSHCPRQQQDSYLDTLKSSDLYLTKKKFGLISGTFDKVQTFL